MDSTEQATTIDSIILELGDCALFQILMVIVLHGAALPVKWSTTFMQYGVYNPGWACADQAEWDNHSHLYTVADYDLTIVSMVDNHTANNYSSSCEVYDHCKNVVYSNESSTIVTEWNLACDKTWISSMMISFDLAGQTTGIFFAGILSDKLGRKPTHIAGLTLLAVLNLIAMFSTKWPMYTAMRFFIGIFSGVGSLTNYMYTMEFLTNKWRAIVSALPFTNMAAMLFALVAMWLKDWRYIHLATAVFTFAFLAPMMWAPESIRWLMVKGKLEKVVKAVHKIEKTNRRQAKSLNVIYSLSEKEVQVTNEAKRRSILDLYRRGFWKRTTVITYTWIRVIICTNIIMYGIASLSGDFYINLILFNSITIVTLPFLPLLTHLLGRKIASFIMLGSSCAILLGLVLLHFVTLDIDKGLATSVLSMFLFVFLDAEWCILMLRCVEVYPTNLRSLSYGYSNTLGKIGGILAPFLIPHDERTLFIAHIVMATITLVNLPALCFLPETKDRPLDDYEDLV